MVCLAKKLAGRVIIAKLNLQSVLERDAFLAEGARGESRKTYGRLSWTSHHTYQSSFLKIPPSVCCVAVHLTLGALQALTDIQCKLV